MLANLSDQWQITHQLLCNPAIMLEIGAPSQPEIVGYIGYGPKVSPPNCLIDFKTGGIENCDCPELGLSES